MYNPQYGIDNNSDKWGKIDKYTSLKCISFDEAKYIEDLEVLITVGDPYAIGQISEQLKAENIHFCVLTEILEKWFKYLPLPNHLAKMDLEQKKIILLNTPEHDNVGDHLITLSEMEFLQNHFTDYNIYEVTDIEYLRYHGRIKNFVSQQDLILITGGGFLGSLWLYNGENNVRNIISEYPDNRIIVLPQTIYFENNIRGIAEFEKSKLIYNSHRDIVFFARENESYQQLVKMVDDDKMVKLFPDMAMLYQSGIKNRYKRAAKRAIVCLRNDKEKIIDDIDKGKIIEYLSNNGFEVNKISMHSGEFGGIDVRKYQVDKKLREISDVDIVITDTLHCMISSALVGTKCIAFNNLSGKVRNVYKWIEDLDYIYYCTSIEESYSIIDGIDCYSTCEYKLDGVEEYERKLEDVVRGVY
jgi:pyruvyl transferase EpsI